MEEKTIFSMLKGKEREQCLADMSKYQRTLFEELENDSEKAKGYNLKDLIYDFDKDFVEKILEIELEEYLNEHKEENRKNGYTRGIELTIGDKKINFNRPRLRKEEGFDSIIIPKKTKFINEIKDDVITLYARNNSVNEIKEILQEMFDIKISTATISKMSQEIKEEVMNWRNRQLEKSYFTINIDCIYITLRDRREIVSHKVPVYIAVGTRLTGNKEIVGMYLGNEDEEKKVIDEMYNQNIGESKTYWQTIFNDLKDRGVEKVLFVISDGVVGMEDAVKDEFPEAKYQRCVVHLSMNLGKYANKSERGQIIKDFKKIYTSATREEADERYKDFREKYKRKKTILKRVEEYYKLILPLYNEPINIRKYIYTNNIVESTNSKIKRGFYGRGALPTVESAINIIYVNIRDLENKWAKKKVNNWENIKEELMTVYKKEIEEYL